MEKRDHPLTWRLKVPVVADAPLGGRDAVGQVPLTLVDVVLSISQVVSEAGHLVEPLVFYRVREEALFTQEGCALIFAGCQEATLVRVLMDLLHELVSHQLLEGLAEAVLNVTEHLTSVSEILG